MRRHLGEDVYGAMIDGRSRAGGPRGRTARRSNRARIDRWRRAAVIAIANSTSSAGAVAKASGCGVRRVPVGIAAASCAATTIGIDAREVLSLRSADTSVRETRASRPAKRHNEVMLSTTNKRRTPKG